MASFFLRLTAILLSVCYWVAVATHVLYHQKEHGNATHKTNTLLVFFRYPNLLSQSIKTIYVWTRFVCFCFVTKKKNKLFHDHLIQPAGLSFLLFFLQKSHDSRSTFTTKLFLNNFMREEMCAIHNVIVEITQGRHHNVILTALPHVLSQSFR